MRDIQQALMRWGSWTLENHKNTTGLSVTARISSVLPRRIKLCPRCCDTDAIIISDCLARLSKNNIYLHDLLIDYYINGMTLISLARKHGGSDTYIGKKLKQAEGMIAGMLIMLDITLEMDSDISVPVHH